MEVFHLKRGSDFQEQGIVQGIHSGGETILIEENSKQLKLPDSSTTIIPEFLEDRPEQSNNLSSTGNPSPTHKKKSIKTCGVCGDRAKSFHFGGLSCDSCKAFFRRSVHNEAYSSFHCSFDKGCTVNISNRKSCQYCRFQKCLSIGMEKNWVMTEDERNQLLKQRKEKKFGPSSDGGGGLKKDKLILQGQPLTSSTETEFEPDVSKMLDYMTVDERGEIEKIVNDYQYSYREIPFKVSNCETSRNSVEIIQMFTTILRRFAYFTRLLPEFTKLSINDQSTLLRAGVLEMCLLRSALSFDFQNNRWPKTENMDFLKDCPQLRVEDMQRLVSKELYSMHMQFINGIQELKADEPTVMLLLLIVLFYPERNSLEDWRYVTEVQEKYLLLLKKYVRWRYGPRASKTFPKLLTKLADLRQLNDSHTEYNLRMSRNEVETIQHQLGNINLNPYPQWVLVKDQLQRKGEGGENSTAQGHSGGHGSNPNLLTQPQAQLHQHPQPEFLGNIPSSIPQGGQPEGQGHFPDGGPQAQMSFPQQFSQPGGHGQPNEISSGGMGLGMGMGMPSARDLFMHFVNRKIPVLIANPFAQFPGENEMMLGASGFLESMGSGGGAGGGGFGPNMFPSQGHMNFNPQQQQQQQPSLNPTIRNEGSNTNNIVTSICLESHPRTESPSGHPSSHVDQGQVSQFKEILESLGESSDPAMLRQLKDSLSPAVVSKLQSVFGNLSGATPEGSQSHQPTAGFMDNQGHPMDSENHGDPSASFHHLGYPDPSSFYHPPTQGLPGGGFDSFQGHPVTSTYDESQSHHHSIHQEPPFHHHLQQSSFSQPDHHGGGGSIPPQDHQVSGNFMELNPHDQNRIPHLQQQQGDYIEAPQEFQGQPPQQQQQQPKQPINQPVMYNNYW